MTQALGWNSTFAFQLSCDSLALVSKSLASVAGIDTVQS